MARRGARGSHDVRRVRDVARITTITMSRPSTPYKSPWSSKVNSFHYVIHYMSPLDGILLDRHSLCIARCVMTGTCTREDDQGARGMEDAKTVAWKRRRKRASRVRGGTTAPASGTTAPSAAQDPLLRQCAVLPPSLAVLPPPPAVLPLRRAVLPPATSQKRLRPAPAVLPLVPAVLPLLRAASREYSLVSLSHLPPWVNTINRPPCSRSGDKTSLRKSRVELHYLKWSPSSPFVGMVPPRVEKIPSWIRDLHL